MIHSNSRRRMRWWRRVPAQETGLIGVASGAQFWGIGRGDLKESEGRGVSSQREPTVGGDGRVARGALSPHQGLAVGPGRANSFFGTVTGYIGEQSVLKLLQNHSVA